MKDLDLAQSYAFPIDRLPTEILFIVLSFLISAWTPTRDDKLYRHPWLMLRSVCRLWRDAIDGDPSHWTNINDPCSETYVALVMRNSSVDNPLTVSGTLGSPRVFATPLLLASNHISELQLRIADIASLNHIITAEFPRLRTVKLASTPDVIAHIHTTVPFHQSFHGVWSLTLTHIKLPMSSLTQLCALRSLSLFYKTSTANNHLLFTIPLEPFLSMLRLQLQLESLRITATFDATSLATSGPPSRLCLSSLSALFLDATTSDAAIFLSRLRLPRIRHLDLILYEFRNFGPGSHTADVVLREARDLIEIMGLSPSTLWTAPSHSIVVEHIRSDAHLRLEFIPSSPYDAQARYMAYIIRRIGGHGIRTLKLDASGHPSLMHPPPTEPTAHWVDLLTLLPNITEIVVSDTGYAVETLPTSLGDLSQTGMLLCPRLDHIVFCEGGFRTTQCQAWILALSQRLDGGNALHTLSFSAWSFPWDFWLEQFEERCVHLIAERVDIYRYFEDQDGSDDD